MQLNHTTDFANFVPAIAAERATLTLTSDTRVETRTGWCTVDQLTPGAAIASLDGGFVPLRHIQSTTSCVRGIHIPGGVLDTCSDVIVPGDTYVALRTPDLLTLTDAPYIMAPANALIGFCGIRPVDHVQHRSHTLRFDTEELIFAQTGLMLHARLEGHHDSFFPTLNYGETRGALALISAQNSCSFLAAA